MLNVMTHSPFSSKISGAIHAGNETAESPSPYLSEFLTTIWQHRRESEGRHRRARRAGDPSKLGDIPPGASVPSRWAFIAVALPRTPQLAIPPISDRSGEFAAFASAKKKSLHGHGFAPVA
jgi:hypothetical protein